jgi:capsular exopolysaccharide synthesis family protein
LTVPASFEAEQYQTLRLKLEGLQRARDVRLIAVTSPGTRDGKTVTAINLAGALSQGSDARVLLIEADLRRPAVSRYLALAESGTPGLGDIVLHPSRRLEDAVLETEWRFKVVLAGSTGAPVHEMFRSRRLGGLLRQARQEFDYVILDTPPLGPVSDCALLTRWIDGVLLVVAAHRTSRTVLEGALNLLEGGQVLGMVFNGDDRPFSRYRRHYRRGYAPRPDSDPFSATRGSVQP